METLACTSKPPKHYTLSIESFSSIASDETYESGEFNAGGYKWKLVLFPNGNKNRDVKDHISLYIKMAGKKAIKPSKIVTITGYKFFLLNRYMGKKSYMFHEESYNKKEKYCFYRTIVGGLVGVDRLISLEEFNDPKKGYLVDDACEFGVEVYVSETRNKNKRECLLTSLNDAKRTCTWKVANFSESPDKKWSGPFVLKDQEYCAWNLELYPKGRWENGDYLSLYLWLHRLPPYELPLGSKIHADFTLRILDQNHQGEYYSQSKSHWFIAADDDNLKYSGFEEMIKLEENARFSVNDSCKIEVDITVLGVTMPGKY